jgi:Ca2+-transporting ATPase
VLKVVHDKVAGRIRFHVQGLRHSRTLKDYLEAGLRHRRGITHVSASTITGNVLLSFNSKQDHTRIIDTVYQLLDGWTETPPSACRKESKTSAFERNPGGGAVQQAIRDRTPSGKAVAHQLLRRFRTESEYPSEPWHTKSVEEVAAVLDTHVTYGLSEEEAGRRLKTYGPNQLPEPSPRSKWTLFASQFLSLPVALLGTAAGLSVVTGGLFEAVAIMGVVVANAIIGYVTESESERTIQSLQKVVRPHASLVRAGRLRTIPAHEVVPGDLIALGPGDFIPADARLVASDQLSVDESALTGESIPVGKTVDALLSANVPLSDRTNMVYMGTLVLSGRGLAIVVATGRHSEMGSIHILLQETTAPETPIERQLRQMGDHLVLFGLSICGFVFVVGLVRGYGLLMMLRTAVSLAAAAIPEGLPAAATTTFALAIRGMKEHGVLIRHLHAAETLGAVQVICFDKTGTITQNRMTVMALDCGRGRVDVRDGRFIWRDQDIEAAKDECLWRLLQVAALCNETEIENDSKKERSYKLRGSPTERAIMETALQAGVDIVAFRRSHPVLHTRHRAENRLFMSTTHQRPEGGRLLAVKGNPVEVLEQCAWRLEAGDTVVAISEEDRLQIQMENERMAGNALRVLGVAYATFDGDRPEDGLTWLGLIGMADPIREGVKELIAVFHQAGIDTIMITGDQSPTAQAVAQQLNLSRGKPLVILDSSEFGSLSPEMMEALATKAHAYSRVSPALKLQIVQALQLGNRVVAMTGDGINDGPALKAADIGIAMGRSGTDLAREVADVVLENDDLETLVTALADGRTIHTNIKKSVHYFLSTNFSEIMVMASAMAMGIGAPLNTMQLLWINTVSDIFPGLALALEPAEPDILKQPPREAQAPLFSKEDYRRMTWESATISAGAMGAYAYGIKRYGMGSAAGSLAFQSLTLGQLLHAFSCRSEHHSLFEGDARPPNPHLNWAMTGTLLLQACTFFVPPLRRLLGIPALNWLDAAVIGGTALASLLVNESTKTTKASGIQP